MIHPHTKIKKENESDKGLVGFGVGVKLPKVTIRRKKRVGRGVGSGKGSHTAGRGQKGQKSMGDIHVLFEGVKTKKSFLKRLPLLRGKGKFHAKKSRRTKMSEFRAKKASK